MKPLPAECRTTAQPSQSIHGQVHPGFTDITPCESPWLCYCQILNTVHGNQENKSLPQTPLQIYLHKVKENVPRQRQSWLKGKVVQDALRACAPEGTVGQNPRSSTSQGNDITGLFQQQSHHPYFCLVDYEFPSLLQKLFSLNPSKGMVHSQQSYLY